MIEVIKHNIRANELEKDTVQFTVDIPIFFGSETVPATATGAATFAHTTIKLDNETLKFVKSAKVIIDYEWAATADGEFQLYDATAASVVASSTTKTGGEVSDWEEFDVTGELVAGNTIELRANITTAGGTGEVVTLHRAILRLVVGVS